MKKFVILSLSLTMLTLTSGCLKTGGSVSKAVNPCITYSYIYPDPSDTPDTKKQVLGHNEVHKNNGC